MRSRKPRSSPLQFQRRGCPVQWLPPRSWFPVEWIRSSPQFPASPWSCAPPAFVLRRPPRQNHGPARLPAPPRWQRSGLTGWSDLQGHQLRQQSFQSAPNSCPTPRCEPLHSWKNRRCCASSKVSAPPLHHPAGLLAPPCAMNLTLSANVPTPAALSKTFPPWQLQPVSSDRPAPAPFPRTGSPPTKSLRWRWPGVQQWWQCPAPSHAGYSSCYSAPLLPDQSHR